MKKMFFIVVFLSYTISVFGYIPALQTLFMDYIYTSEGTFYGAMYYYGKNRGQELANDTNSYDHYVYTDKVSNGRWEAIRYMLNRYQHSTGDTYSFYTAFYHRGSRHPVSTWNIIIEFTSSTRYTMWAFYDNTSDEIWR